mmetsp:Transcript_25509/g.42783  ORF Transcript_25509/g.42783 Transcript_25509/m.42783 type:complete len:472 (-) Transcript_25509:762-2177(-)
MWIPEKKNIDPSIYMWVLLICASLMQIAGSGAVKVSSVVTTRDGTQSLTPQQPIFFDLYDDNAAGTDTADEYISIDETIQFQKIIGIGSSLESSTCYNLMHMSQETRTETLKMILDKEDGIGMSLMRITIGTSDFAPLPFYSYDDVEEGSEDFNLEHFSIEADREFILPVLKEAAQYTVVDVDAGDEEDDGLRFFASSWSPPGWMKDSGSLLGGAYKSDPEYLAAYASYLSKFLAAYEEEGIHVSALTPQNEPLQDEDTYPTAHLKAETEADLIGNHLGPLLESTNSSTAIWCFDHNFNTLYYPETVLGTAAAAGYIAATAFHFYGGQPSAMTQLHEEFPSKDVVFSEGSEFGVRGAAGLVRILRNWARTYTAWVTMLDTQMQPNAGPFRPHTTMLELDLDTLQPIYKFEYYMYGQFSKYIRPGAVRIDSSTTMTPASSSRSSRDGESIQVAHVAFRRPLASSSSSSSNKY